MHRAGSVSYPEGHTEEETHSVSWLREMVPGSPVSGWVNLERSKTIPTVKEAWDLESIDLNGKRVPCHKISAHWNLSSFRKQGVGQFDWREKFPGAIVNWSLSSHKELWEYDLVLLAIIWTKRASGRKAEVVVAGQGCHIPASINPGCIEQGLGTGTCQQKWGAGRVVGGEHGCGNGWDYSRSMASARIGTSWEWRGRAEDLQRVQGNGKV